jgi:hypothetical protein
MQLLIQMSGYGDEELELEKVITSFDDQDRFALQVGRAVKRFIRNVPVRKQRSRLTINVDAYWTEAAPRAERKSKKGKKAAAEESDGG